MFVSALKEEKNEKIHSGIHRVAQLKYRVREKRHFHYCLYPGHTVQGKITSTQFILLDSKILSPQHIGSLTPGEIW